MNLLPIDELNALRTRLLYICAPGPDGKIPKDQRKLCMDEILDLLIIAYAFGNEDANEMLNVTITPTDSEARKSIYAKVAGKDWVERVNDYLDEADVEAIIKVAETEAHRIYNESANTTAKKGGATKKTWVCTFHNSRDTHIDIHGTTVPMDAEFYTYLGNHAMFPGQFGVAEEDCGCLCYLRYS